MGLYAIAREIKNLADKLPESKSTIKTTQWGVKWVDGQISIADSEVEARNLAKRWRPSGVVKRQVTTHTGDWEEVDN